MRRFFYSFLVYFTSLELVAISLYILLTVFAWMRWDQAGFLEMLNWLGGRDFRKEVILVLVAPILPVMLSTILMVTVMAQPFARKVIPLIVFSMVLAYIWLLGMGWFTQGNDRAQAAAPSFVTAAGFAAWVLHRYLAILERQHLDAAAREG